MRFEPIEVKEGESLDAGGNGKHHGGDGTDAEDNSNQGDGSDTERGSGCE